MAIQEMKVVSKKDLDKNFFKEVSSIPGGEKIKDCIQCGMCSGSCPVSFIMDYTPRRIIEMVRRGHKKEVLSCNTPWICSSCYSCTVRCPKEIKITDVMYALKRIASKEKTYPKDVLSPMFFNIFANNIASHGRVFEPELMARFMLKNFNLRNMIGYAPLGIKLFLRGRMPIFPKRIKGRKEIQKILKIIEAGEK